MLDLELVRSFAVLATELHFGRAARKLNLSQPPLSRRIQSLEAFLGVTLFERDRRSVSLTAAGKAFYPDAVDIIQRSEAAVRAARQTTAAKTERIVLGFIGAMTYGYLPSLISRARKALPHTELVLRELTSREQAEAVGLGEIDIGLLRPLREGPELASRTVYKEELSIALPMDHPLAVRRRIPLQALDGQDFVGYSQEGRYMQDLIGGALASRNVNPNYIQRLSRTQAVLALVSIGMGVAIVPDQARSACFDNVVFRRIERPDEIEADLVAVWRQGSLTGSLADLLELME